MPHETPITINQVLNYVARHEYVLPAIQREFVWDPPQICRLFDSLMQGYPIGSFLFWRVKRESVTDYKFFDFVRTYHQKDSPHCPPLDVAADEDITAVLDGQQRLTALNIGLRGTHAEKEPRKWWNNPDAFPVKQLYLNLSDRAAENEEGMAYDFRFLTAAWVEEEEDHWFPVSNVVSMEAGPPMNAYLVEHGLGGDVDAFQRLWILHQCIHTDLNIDYFLEEAQDLDRVLNIFIRVNSGGTVLSYSDLLLSIATAQWDDLDARQEIHGLVDELNAEGMGFRLSKDFVLKAGLMLSDISNIGFRVTNFNRQNMELLQDQWHEVRRALRMAVRLAADFGFSERTMSADSALLPIAYYMKRRSLRENYLGSSDSRSDREAIRLWLVRSLLKSGIWGAGLDTLLATLRETIKEAGGGAFPTGEIESAMRGRGRSLMLEEEEIEDLVETSYGDRKAFPILALLYPFVDLKNRFHVDHIFPRKVFNRRTLRRDGFAEEDIDSLQDRSNRLPNLALLDGQLNQEKSAKYPRLWIEETYTDATSRQAYLDRHDLGDVPEDLTGFHGFYERRRAVMADKLRTLVGRPESGETSAARVGGSLGD